MPNIGVSLDITTNEQNLKKVEAELKALSKELSDLKKSENKDYQRQFELEEKLKVARESQKNLTSTLKNQYDIRARVLAISEAGLPLNDEQIADAQRILSLELEQLEVQKQLSKEQEFRNHQVEIEATRRKRFEIQDELAGGLAARNRGFSNLSQEVGQAGDIKTNVESPRAVLSALGLEDLGADVYAAGRFAALAEELPRLKYAMESFPEVAKAATESMGGLKKGAGLIGAMGLLVIAAIVLRKEYDKGVESANKAASALKFYYDIITEGTTESAKIELEKKQKELERQELELAGLKEIRDEANKVFDEIESNDTLKTITLQQSRIIGLYADLGKSMNLLGGEAKTSEENYNELRITVGETKDQIKILEQALEDGSLAANDAAAAEKRLQEERSIDANAEFNRLKSLINDQKTLDRLIKEGKGGDAQALLDQRADDLDTRNREIEALRILIAERKRNNEITTEQEAELNELIKTRDRENASLEYLTYTYQDNIDSVNRYAGFIESTNKTIAEGASKYIDDAKRRLSYDDIIANANAENFVDRLEQVNTERRTLQALIPQIEAMGKGSEETASLLQGLQDEIAGLNDEFNYLSNNGLPVLKEKILETLDTDIAKILEEQATKIAELNSKLATAIAKEEAELNAKLAKLSADTNEKRLDVNDKYTKDLIKAEEKRQKALLEAARNFSKSSLDALRNRDAVALTKAEEKYAEDILKANEAYAEQKKALDDKLKEQLSDVIKNENDKRRELLNSHNIQLQQLRQKNQADISAIQQKYQNEISLRTQQYNRELQLLNSMSATSVSIVGNMVTGVISQFSRLNQAQLNINPFGSSSAYSTQQTSYLNNTIDYRVGLNLKGLF